MCDSADSWVGVEEVLIWVVLQKEKEDLEDISNELELADEEDMIPYVIASFLRPNSDPTCRPTYPHMISNRTNVPNSYQIGDSFISLPLPEVQELLTTNSARIEEEVSVLEEKLGTIKEGMQELKVELYARFGRSINLET